MGDKREFGRRKHTLHAAKHAALALSTRTVERTAKQSAATESAKHGKLGAGGRRVAWSKWAWACSLQTPLPECIRPIDKTLHTRRQERGKFRGSGQAAGFWFWLHAAVVWFWLATRPAALV